MRTPSPRLSVLLRRWGGLLLAVGLISNQWVLGRLLSPDGVVDDPVDLAILYTLQGTLIVWGLLNLVFSRRLLMAKLNLAALALLVASPVLAELGIRLAIAARVSAFRQPDLYFDAYCDDNYWKLLYLWNAKQPTGPARPTKMQPDPMLGWVPATSADNPLGVIRDSPYEVKPEESVFLFYGDSFVEGTTAALGDRIPQQLERLLTEQQVFNLGVSGYGVDQIYLRLRATHGHWQQPQILFGLLTSDLDRSILQFRMAPKPYYQRAGGTWKLAGPPLPADPQEWLRDHPPRVFSYAAALAAMRWRLHAPGNLREYPRRQEEKIEVNRFLLREIVTYCRDHHLPLLFVVFYDPEELGEPGWREQFLKKELAALDAPYLDTKPILRQAAKNQHCSWWDFHQPDHHLNAAGNHLIAEALAETLQAETAKTTRP